MLLGESLTGALQLNFAPTTPVSGLYGAYAWLLPWQNGQPKLPACLMTLSSTRPSGPRLVVGRPRSGP